MTHPHPNRKFIPQAVLTKSGKINTAGASVNTVVRRVNTAGSKPTVNHPRPISNAYKKGYSQGNPQQKEYKEKGVIDSGYSRHMTGNKCYLTEYEDYHGGFVSFGDGKGRISGKGDKRELSVARTPQQNGVAERRNRTLIEAARTIYSVSAAGPSFTNDDPSSPVNAAEASNAFEEHLFERFSPFKNAFTLPPVSNVTPMDDTRIFGNAYDDEDVGVDADLNNLETTMNVSPIPTTRIDMVSSKEPDHCRGEQITKIIRTAYLPCFSLSNRTQESDSSSGRSKLDRSNARGASTISTSEGLDTVYLPNGRGHWNKMGL
ncbi:ribonuclease H-like domain-containing protein [Tanacetum coccineum]